MKPHDLRRFVGTQLAKRDPRVGQLVLGHASIQTTQQYTHVDRDRLRSIHRRFHPRGGEQS